MVEQEIGGRVAMSINWVGISGLAKPSVDGGGGEFIVIHQFNQGAAGSNV